MDDRTIFNFMYIFSLTKHKTMKEWVKLLQIEQIEVCFYIIFEESSES